MQKSTNLKLGDAGLQGDAKILMTFNSDNIERLGLATEKTMMRFIFFIFGYRFVAGFLSFFLFQLWGLARAKSDGF